MIPPDIIIVWPKNIDYPLFRQFLKKEKSRFNEIVIVFTDPHFGDDYSGFVKDSLFSERALCLDSIPVNNAIEDWRNVAVHSAFIHSLHSEWVLFFEQDFIPQPGFWEEVDRLVNTGNRVVGVYDGDRLHPCFLLIKRDLLKQTTMNFSANPPHWDHFGKIQKDLEALNEPIGRVEPRFWYHMAGLSHNCRLMFEGELPNYKLEEFKTYVKKCLTLPGDMLHKQFVHSVTGFLNAYG